MSKIMKIEGLPIRNAKRKMTLTILAQDIKNASVKRPEACAIARACNRQFDTEARIHLGRIYLKARGHWNRFLTPTALRNEIIAFDRGGTFEPGRYTLAPLTPAERAYRPRQTQVRTAKGKSTPRHKHVTQNVRAMPANS